MLAIRLAKISCVAAIGLYVALVAFGNLTDYWTNFRFVTEVLDMDDVPVASAIHWRAITAPVLHHAGYILIITAEAATAALCALGALAMARKSGPGASVPARQEHGGGWADARVPAL